MKGTDGVVAVLPDVARAESPSEFGFVIVRRDLGTLKAFVGQDCESPHIGPTEVELVAARSIRRYDLVET